MESIRGGGRGQGGARETECPLMESIRGRGRGQGGARDTEYPPMEARVLHFRELIDKGRPYKVFELVLLELQLVGKYKNRKRAAYEAHWSAGFYGLPDMDIERKGTAVIRLPKRR